MQKVFDRGRQSHWQDNNNYYICSTSIDNSEVMVFEANKEGEVISYMDLYVSYIKVHDHDFHMARFAKENESHGS